MTTTTLPKALAPERFEHAAVVERVQQSITENDGLVAVVTLEAANFPRIFARFGHDRGSQLLNGLAQRINGAMRPGDVAMQVGDHLFVVIVSALKNTGHAVLAGKKLLRVSEPEMPGPSIMSTDFDVRAGIALFPTHCEEPQLLLQQSKMALEVAKETGKDLVVFDHLGAEELTVGWEMRDELSEAVREGELEVWYQPKIDMKTRKTTGAEALMRWFSPVRGSVPPSRFFAVAENSELLTPMTRYALNTALRNVSQWRKNGHECGVAVNLSATMLLDKGLVEMIRSMLSIWNTPASALTVEITESAIMADVDASFATMNQLKALGIRISIDDFGTGYSSFSYFKDIPADELKIDRAFVAGMTEQLADQHIVETIISLAHRFNLKVVAEGIEDEATLDALREFDCDIGQGYFIARPMPQSDMATWLEGRPPQ